jgi:hypothetical protein
MNIQNFFAKWNNIGADFDGAFGNQCVDLVQFYNQEVVGGPHLVGAGAKDIWDTYPKNTYDRIPNTPTGVPVMGDIMIWGIAAGPFGHIAVVKSADVNNFTSFDQNWPQQGVQDGSGNFIGTGVCHFQGHNYTSPAVLGWLHPKVQQLEANDALARIKTIVDAAANAGDIRPQIKAILAQAGVS